MSWSHRLGVGLAVFAAACAGHGSPTAPSPGLDETIETPHYVFHFGHGDGVDGARQEAFHDWFTALYGVNIGRRIDYYKHASRSDLQAATGLSTNGFAEPEAFTVHTIWPWDAHEVIHVYTASFGRPTDFFNEGIAVGLSTDPLGSRFTPLWNSQPVDEVSRGFLRTGRVPPLRDIAETTRFRALDDQLSYPVSGSFVRFLHDTYGVDRIRIFFANGSRDDAIGRIRSTFQSAFGVDLDAADDAWRRFLDTGVR